MQIACLDMVSLPSSLTLSVTQKGISTLNSSDQLQNYSEFVLMVPGSINSTSHRKKFSTCLFSLGEGPLSNYVCFCLLSATNLKRATRSHLRWFKERAIVIYKDRIKF